MRVLRKAETIGPDTSRGGRERTALAEWEAGAPFEADRPPTLRPPTTGEWIRGRAQAALESLADVLPLTEQLGATSFGAKAEELGDPRGKVLGAMMKSDAFVRFASRNAPIPRFPGARLACRAENIVKRRNPGR
jgi:hypothetical protein